MGKLIYSDALTDKICEYLEMGATARDTCAAVGINEETFYNWQNVHPSFKEKVNRARVASRLRGVKILRDLATDTDVPARDRAQIMEWMLERTDPENWSHRKLPVLVGNVSIDLVNRFIIALQDMQQSPDVVMEAIIARRDAGRLADQQMDALPDSSLDKGADEDGTRGIH